ncbi:hypothetical protein MTCD1_00271 [Colwellia marinimaniae]|uniref:Lipoprotein n=1 Tax=Colwellia marinimaniae TaxID=1513592 RepID=A0ABQ0MQR0_9GAMM|nr:hypothetical protein MTCD1_00271 [Colwellia marinimaniae]
MKINLPSIKHSIKIITVYSSSAMFSLACASFLIGG